MPSLEASFEAACSHGKIPGAVLVATDKTGHFKYSKAFGFHSLEEGKQEPLETDAMMEIASCTKLITTIAALQCVERGLIELDDDVNSILPELTELDILEGIDSATGKPMLKKRENKITLRLLLTHSSGVAYYSMSPLHEQYHTSQKLPLKNANPTILSRFTEPLLFEPGTSWHYGAGIDFAGLVVERLNRTTLEEYMQEHIWKPLGITDITFWVDKYPKLLARKAGMTIRDPTVPDGSGKILHYDGPNIFAGVTDCMGGQGVCSSMPAYLEILRSILIDDEKLLKKSTSAMMFEPQLTERSQAAIQDIFSSKEKSGLFVGEFPETVRYDWGLGGVLTLDDVDEDGLQWRRKGCLIWSGLPNLFWFVDREAGLCGIYGGQVLPPGDLQTREMIGLFDRAMYERLAEFQGRKAEQE